MFCSLCPHQLRKDKSAIFEKITDMILWLDVAKKRTEEIEDYSRLDYIIEQLYELRMFADNMGSCPSHCSICYQEAIEKTVRNNCDHRLRLSLQAIAPSPPTVSTGWKTPGDTPRATDRD
jgi:hypothetical protein